MGLATVVTLIGVFLGWSISVTIRGGGLARFTIPFGALAVIVVLLAWTCINRARRILHSPA